jgi:hypothetical protein
VIRSTGNAPAERCASCGKPAPKPKKGLCHGCYLRGHRGHTIGADCMVCGNRDLRVLRRHKVAQGPDEPRVFMFVVLCANDAAIAGRRLLTLDELRAEVFPPEDRRRGDRRRGPRRAPRERRVRVDVERLIEGDRREGSRR